MSATYEPGTVAVATFCDEPNVRVSRYGHGWVNLTDPDDFIDDNDRYEGGEPRVTDVRPLAVLDPEDREQVERLARTTHVALTGDVPSWPTLSGKDQVRRMDALTMALHAEIDAVRALFEGVSA